MATNEYMFSVIIPVYNVEPYLDDTIKSVINQTVGFEKNIQLILINDGSADGSGDICIKYRDAYPENITYVYQENAGVSNARNAGLKLVKGKYVNFLDSDDMWKPDTFAKVTDFFARNPGVKMVAGRFCMFGRQEGFVHPTDYKFDKERIIDITKTNDYPQLSSSSMFFASELVCNKEFDTSLTVSEDVKYISEILAEEKLYGILPSAVYMYRKRESLNSAIDTSMKKKSWYFATPRECYQAIFDMSTEKFGEVLPYFQNLVMYDLQWRIRGEIADNLTTEEKAEYIALIKSLLDQIDDQIILNQKHMNYRFKLATLSIKHGRDVIDELAFDKASERYKFNGMDAIKMNGVRHVLVNVLEVHDDTLMLEGILNLVLDGRHGRIAVKKNKKIIEVERYNINHKRINAFDGTEVFDGRAYKVQMKIKPGDKVRFVFITNDGETIQLRPTFNDNAKLNRDIRNSYYATKKNIVMLKDNTLFVQKKTLKNRIMSELKYQYYLRKKGVKGVSMYRILGIIQRHFCKKRIWIFSDRTTVAGDNGEALFKYVVSHAKDIDAYFAVNEQSKDYARMQQYGKVLAMDSFKYKMRFLCAEKIISAHADAWTINAFGENGVYMKDFYDFDFAFLQHGITKDDISSWITKHNKNIKLLVTAAVREYDSIVNGDYSYTANEVKLTGFPRYDYLEDRTERKIVFLPTWRKNIAGKVIEGTSEREYYDTFVETDYFKFYNGIINDERIIAAMEKYGYTGDFYVHPSFSRQACDFKGNDRVKVHEEPAIYSKVFAENALMITDYSSVAFDFCYLKKPVIYSQYDRDTFFQNHLYQEGYFSYENDGFGPVCHEYENIIETIISYMANGCVMEDKYVQRVDAFFKYTDKNNCERVFEELCKL